MKEKHWRQNQSSINTSELYIRFPLITQNTDICRVFTRPSQGCAVLVSSAQMGFLCVHVKRVPGLRQRAGLVVTGLCQGDGGMEW